jgi:hypothetical protein
VYQRELVATPNPDTHHHQHQQELYFVATEEEEERDCCRDGGGGGGGELSRHTQTLATDLNNLNN